MRLNFDCLQKESLPTVCPDDLVINYGVVPPPLDESMISAPRSTSEPKRASSLIEAWRLTRVSKWNHLREYSGHLPKSFVLVIDQYLDDASVEQGNARVENFSLMLDVALAENPDCDVVVLVHPKVSAETKHGHFDPARLKSMPRVLLMPEDKHPVRLIEESKAGYTVTSLIGFEALIWGKPVRTFGMPFYSGWGLTQDDLPASPSASSNGWGCNVVFGSALRHIWRHMTYCAASNPLCESLPREASSSLLLLVRRYRPGVIASCGGVSPCRPVCHLLKE